MVVAHVSTVDCPVYRNHDASRCMHVCAQYTSKSFVAVQVSFADGLVTVAFCIRNICPVYLV